MRKTLFNNKIIKVVFISIIVLTVFTVKIGLVSAASLSILSSTASTTIGQNISLSFEVSSNEPINAISGKIVYNKDLLRVVSINKSNSIVNFWTQEPDYLSTQGEINIEGVILNPGFAGQRGRIISINFFTIKEGSALFSLKNASVLANDGSGTSLQTSTGVAKLNITKDINTKNPPKEDFPAIPKSEENPELSSPTTEVQPETGLNITYPEITDYPIEVKAGNSFEIKGEGGQVPVTIYAVKIRKNKIFGNYITYYRDITNLEFDLKKKAITKDSTFQAEFSIMSGGGKYGFYAKDQAGNLSEVVFVEISNNFLLDIKYLLLNYWWIGLIAIIFVISNYISWRLGRKSAIK